MDFIEKRLDKLGRIVLPKEFREKIGLKNNSKVLVTLKNESICIFSEKIGCALCNIKLEDVAEIRLCKECIEKIKQL